MERLTLAFQRADQALHSLLEALALKGRTDIERDTRPFNGSNSPLRPSGRPRHFLMAREGLDAGSPKCVIRACREVRILSLEEAEHALKMADDRNLTAHTYDRALAQEIFARLEDHAALMTVWLKRLTARMR